MIRIIVLSIFSIVFSGLLWGQVPETADSSRLDTIIEIGEGKLLKNLEKNQNKSGFNRFIHRLLVKKPTSQKAESTSEKFQEKDRIFYIAEGKPIRNIYIDTREPFGYSISDSTEVPDSFLEKAGNALHIKTKNFVIRNYLLLKEGDKFDSLKLEESERLIRNQRFTRRVRIDYLLVGENIDSVDLYVHTLDSWTIIPHFTYSGSKVGIRLRERNFMGWGHDFDNRYRQNFETGKNQFQTRYRIPNIQKTYIGFQIGYYSNEENEYTKGLGFERPFFSPLTRWAGGIYIGQRAYQDSIPNEFQIQAQNFKYNFQDYWGGLSFRLFNTDHSTEERLNNLIIAARYFKLQYVDRPALQLDPNQFYTDQEFYLLGVGVSRRGYVRDRFIRNYDIVEDIPVGMSYGITTGIQRKNQLSRAYLSGEIKYGNYFSLGFMGFDARFGGFIHQSQMQESVLSLQWNYYTRLVSWGNWKFRNFITSNLILGFNRQDTRGDRLTLNENDPLGIDGFYSVDVIGTKKWLTQIQIQSYSPYEFLGFRFSPFLSSTLGVISNDKENLFNGKVYTRIGVGILFNNDYLVFSNFSVSFSWYNSIPGSGENIFKTNTYDISDYEMMDFDFGKPQLIPYNPNVPY